MKIFIIAVIITLALRIAACLWLLAHKEAPFKITVTEASLTVKIAVSLLALVWAVVAIV